MTRIAIPLLVLILIVINPTNAQQECRNCDCYHLPVPEKCEKCCGVESGIITSVEKAHVELSDEAVSGQSIHKTFELKPTTKTNDNLRKGALATVYYKKEGKIADQVNLTESLEGLIVPAGDPDPPNPCTMPIPSGAMKMFLGSSLAWTTGPRAVMLRMGGDEIVAMSRTTKGVAISAKVFSQDGRIVAQIIDNRFYVNPNNFFRIERPDDHSLVVYDQQSKMVLNVRFLNPSSVSVLGAFGFPRRSLVIIEQEKLTLPGNNTLVRFCFGNVATKIDMQ